MKTSGFLLLAISAISRAHTIAQRVSVNGNDNGQLVGIRSPSSDYPIMNVNDANIACNTGIHQPVSSKVIDIPAGAKVGVMWGHVIGGPQVANDPDNPIAKSHKGPVIFYMAKVNDAAASGTSSLQWFKVSQDGLDSSGKWGVDRMIANNGWTYFTMPSCVASGQYLLRAEIIALHSASHQGQAQFYMACAQINVTGGGSKAGTTVSFPGAYSATDPGILINIYDTAGNPTGGGKPYTVPGPAVMTC
ncbi:lytic polysaccharide monooxygenase [Glonium stellatum]|uniref:AA9 family lytic polysaccharide monooxygenase n=1 Tax=Glonium stellatum TaxID=574774 RepID=A0A8E2JPU3_9PEZI|nr:lytic polysaccharide monooxygenase [Glonium stellatum]